ncbi:MAG: hypothetical protein WBB36_18720 [Chitinophagales bacterium]
MELPQSNKSDIGRLQITNLLFKIETSHRWFNFRWQILRRFHRRYTNLLNAKNSHLEFNSLGGDISKHSWQWYLCINLRNDLIQGISDKLIAQIVADFQEYEQNRLAGELAVVGKPGRLQYQKTVNVLNSTYKEFSYWKDSKYPGFDAELFQRIDQCKYKLGPIASHNTSSLFIDGYEDLKLHSFYFNALYSLLYSFSRGQNENLNKKNKVLNLSDYATILIYATDFDYYERKNLEVEYSRFIDTHHLKTTFETLKSTVSAVINKSRTTVKGRLKRIEPVIEEYYPMASAKLKSDQAKRQE